MFNDEWVELWAQRIIFESSLVKEEMQRAEKEAIAKRLNDGLLKRKEGANLAMQFLSNIYSRESRVGDSIARMKDEEMTKAEIGKEEMKVAITPEHAAEAE